MSVSSAPVGFLLGLLFDPEMEMICSSEMSGSLRTTQSYNPEDCTLHSHRREKLQIQRII
jgi:hypothetical protein